MAHDGNGDEIYYERLTHAQQGESEMINNIHFIFSMMRHMISSLCAVFLLLLLINTIIGEKEEPLRRKGLFGGWQKRKN